ncbi:hypothetical protein [Liquorilactobacillus capillatus]|uniref:Uncharacterized protein n=1 Tax=Liquorilactobacillus capillatus DSM 19910 TaxID=1423731 RepID=A0A0R1M0B4_9LACO|nr:hypothetical protein [Liquorilactobacillus capillatus]KRL01407.1 hypothetical protein FC81_GL001552 [Liquorilactobacillus capillatus DSM 19910]
MGFRFKIFKWSQRKVKEDEEQNIANNSKRRTRSRSKDDVQDEQAVHESRTGYRKAQFQIEIEKKRKKLGRKLNWVIGCLVVAIIVAYLFMIFVNF